MWIDVGQMWQDFGTMTLGPGGLASPLLSDLLAGCVSVVSDSLQPHGL